MLKRTCTNHTDEIHTAALPHSYVVLSCGSNLRLEETGELQLQCLQQLRLRYQVKPRGSSSSIKIKFSLTLCGVAMVREVGCMDAEPAQLL